MNPIYLTVVPVIILISGVLYVYFFTPKFLSKSK